MAVVVATAEDMADPAAWVAGRTMAADSVGADTAYVPSAVRKFPINGV